MIRVADLKAWLEGLSDDVMIADEDAELYVVEEPEERVEVGGAPAWESVR